MAGGCSIWDYQVRPSHGTRVGVRQTDTFLKERGGFLAAAVRSSLLSMHTLGDREGGGGSQTWWAAGGGVTNPNLANCQNKQTLTDRCGDLDFGAWCTLLVVCKVRASVSDRRK